MNQSERKKQISHYIGEITSPNKPLTKWEESFLESVSDQFDRTDDLSDKQIAVLERIYKEKCE